jgi:hypothetical protein
MPVVVKVYLKRPEDLQFALAPYHKVLNSFSEKLSVTKQPNVLFYHRMVETDKGKKLNFLILKLVILSVNIFTPIFRTELTQDRSLLKLERNGFLIKLLKD